MNRFEARARQIANRVPPEDLAGHPDGVLSLGYWCWVHFRRWILPTVIFAVLLYLLDFRVAHRDTVRSAAIAAEILGDVQVFDDRAARLRLQERGALITALEKLLVPGAEPGLWPAVARVLGFDAHALFEEENRFELVSIFIQYVSSLPAGRQTETMRLALLKALEGADVMRIDHVRVIAELPSDLRKDLAALSKSEFRALFAGLEAYQAEEASRQHLVTRVQQLTLEVERQRSLLHLELTRLEDERAAISLQRQDTKDKLNRLHQNKKN